MLFLDSNIVQLSVRGSRIGNEVLDDFKLNVNAEEVFSSSSSNSSSSSSNSSISGS